MFAEGRFDVFDATLLALHQLLGHDVTARYLEQPAGDKRLCHLCRPELCTAECRRTHTGQSDPA